MHYWGQAHDIINVVYIMQQEAGENCMRSFIHCFVNQILLGKCKVVTINAMKANRECRGIAPLTFNLSTT